MQETLAIGIVVIEAGAASPGAVQVGADVVSLDYGRGESFAMDAGDISPQFSGKHRQPSGFQLKLPVKGDAIVMHLHDGRVARLGFLRSYLNQVERRYGTKFS